MELNKSRNGLVMFNVMDKFFKKVQPLNLNFLFEVEGWMMLHEYQNNSSHKKNFDKNKDRSRKFARDMESSIIYESIVEYFVYNKTFQDRLRKSK